MVTAETYVLKVSFMWKVNFDNKSGTSHWEISVSCTIQECDNVTTPHYPIPALLSGKWWCLWEVKNNRKSQTFSSKSGCGHLQGGSLHVQQVPK